MFGNSNAGTIWATFGANTKQFLSGISTANAATAGFMQNMNRQMSAMRTLTLAGFGFAGKQAVSMAADFEFSSQKIVGLVGVAQNTVDEWKVSMRDLGKETGKGPRELAESLYYLTSAGIRGTTEAMDTLTSVSKASAAGLGDMTAVSRTVVSAMNAWKSSNLSAEMATSYLVNTVKEGNMVATELAGSFGRVIPIASKMGVGMDEVGASIAALTRYGLNSFEAVTGIRQLLYTFSAPTKAATDELAKFGLTGEYMREVIQEDGLLVAMQTLQEVTGGNIDTLKRIVPNVRALTPLLALLGDNAADTEAVFKSLADTTVDDLNHAFDVQDDRLKMTQEQLKATAEVAIIDFGQALGESLIPLMKGMTLVLDKWNQAVREAPQGVKNFAAAMTALGLVFAGLKIVGALAGIQKGITAISSAYASAGLAAKFGSLGVVLGKLAAVIGVFVVSYKTMTALLKATNSYDFWVNDELAGAPVTYADLARQIVKTEGAYEQLRRAVIKNHVALGGQIKDLGVSSEASVTNTIRLLEHQDALNADAIALQRGNKAKKAAKVEQDKLTKSEKRAAEVAAMKAAAHKEAIDAAWELLDSVKKSKEAYDEAAEKAEYLNEAVKNLSEAPDPEPVEDLARTFISSTDASSDAIIDFSKTVGSNVPLIISLMLSEFEKIPEGTRNPLEEAKEEVENFVNEVNNILEDNLFANFGQSLKDTLVGAMTDGDIIGGITGFFERAAEDSASGFASVFQEFMETGFSGKEGEFNWGNLTDGLNSLFRDEDGNMTMGGISAIAGSAFGLYNAYQSGDSASGMMSGAMGGFALGGWGGAAIGAIVGGLLSVFGGDDKPKVPYLNAGWNMESGVTTYGQYVDGSVISSYKASANEVIKSTFDTLNDSLMRFGDASLFAKVNLDRLTFPEINTDQFKEVITEVLDLWLPGQIRNKFAAAITEGLEDLGYSTDFARRMFQEAARLGGDASLEFIDTVIKGITDLEYALQEINFSGMMEAAGRSAMENFAFSMEQSLSNIALYQERMMNELDLAAMAEDASAIAEVVASAGQAALQMIRDINDAQSAASDSIAAQIEQLYLGGLTEGLQGQYAADRIIELFNSIETAPFESIGGITGDIQQYINDLIGTFGEDQESIDAALDMLMDPSMTAFEVGHSAMDKIRHLFDILSWEDSGAENIREYLIAFLEHLDQEQMDAYDGARSSIESWANLLEDEAGETASILEQMGTSSSDAAGALGEVAITAGELSDRLSELGGFIPDSGGFTILIDPSSAGSLESEILGMIDLRISEVLRS